MKITFSIAKSKKGLISLITLFMLLGVGIFGIGMVITAQANAVNAANYKNKIQTFYAADGLMTLIGQDLIDTNEDLYLTKRPDCDIGSPALAGSYSHSADANKDTVRECGSDIWITSDQFHFALLLPDERRL